MDFFIEMLKKAIFERNIYLFQGPSFSVSMVYLKEVSPEDASKNQQATDISHQLVMD